MVEMAEEEGRREEEEGGGREEAEEAEVEVASWMILRRMIQSPKAMPISLQSAQVKRQNDCPPILLSRNILIISSATPLVARSAASWSTERDPKSMAFGRGEEE